MNTKKNNLTSIWSWAIAAIALLAIGTIALIVLAYFRLPPTELVEAKQARAYDLLFRYSEPKFIIEFPDTEKVLDSRIDQLFEIVYKNIPVFVDKHYTVRGEYNELFLAAFGKLGENIKEVLFGGFESGVDDALADINSAFVVELRKKLLDDFQRDENETIEDGQIKNAINLAIKDTLLRFETGDLALKTSVAAGAGVGGILVVKTITTAALKKLAISSTAKTASKLTGVGGGAAAGATIGSAVPGIGTAIGGFVGGVIGWFTVDKIVVEIDEKINREKFENKIIALVDEQKAIYKAEIRKIMKENMAIATNKTPLQIIKEK